MGFLSKLLGNKPKETELLPSAKVPIAQQNTYSIHPDIRKLLWIADGPEKNYVPAKKQSIFEHEGFRITISFGNDIEPSLISTKMPIAIVEDISSVERPPYYPTYAQLTPQQRGVYWKLLENPYNPSIDIGFVFILYYGLERHLLEGYYEKAFDIILRLRDVHKNSSFQSYSACALLLTSMFRKRNDLAETFFDSLDKEHEFNIPDNLYLLCKFGLDIPLSPKDIMRMSKTFEFDNTNYIKKYPQIFENNLRRELIGKFEADVIDMKHLITTAEWRKLEKQPFPMFANISIPSRTVEIPVISDSFKLKNAIYNVLVASHEATKTQLAEMRKAGAIPVESKPTTLKAEKKVPEFDAAQEQQLLHELKSKSRRTLDKHFCYIALQEFYYKYRDLDEKYLQKCIDYCMKDISLLPEVQSSYRKEELARIDSIASFYSKEELAERRKEVEYFNGTIPAFYRLAVIYEKIKDFESAINICNQAIDYYRSIGMEESTAFRERREKLDNKRQHSA